MIQRYSVYVLLLAVAVSLSSCRRAVEKARRNIRFEGIERVERQGLTGAEVVVRVMNDTGYKLVLDAAEMGVYYAGGRVGTVVLREAVEVPRRTTDSFRTLWQLKISDPLALYVLARKVKSGDLSQVEVSYAVEGRGGPAPVKISRERMPLSDITRQLSRWYDVQFVYETTEFSNHPFTGVVKRDQSLEEVLSIIEKTTNIKFKISGRTIIIKRAEDAANISRSSN